jgi:hypothetical protein
MCTYLTETFECDGAGKGGSGWFTVTEGRVYVDHPYHACHEHTVNIDFVNPSEGPSARVAVELTEEAALALVDAIHKALAAAPPGLASARGPR